MRGMIGTALRRSQLTHPRRAARVRQVVCFTVVMTSVLGLVVTQAMAQEVAAGDARSALDEYIRAWNAADNEAIGSGQPLPPRQHWTERPSGRPPESRGDRNRFRPAAAGRGMGPYDP